MFASVSLRRLVGALPYLLPALVVFVLFTYYPLFNVIYMSFTDADFLRAPNWVGLDNYTKMFSASEFWASLGITTVFAVGVTALEVVLGMMLGFLMNSKTRVTALLRAAVFAPVVISVSATAILWLFFLNTQGGPVNRALAIVGIPPIGWFTDPQIALFGVIVVAVWKGVDVAA